jgi:FkbM family methyltransferase
LFAERDGDIASIPGSWLYRNRERFNQLYEYLSDDFSRDVLLNVAIARMFQGFNFSMVGNIFAYGVTTLPQYFDRHLISFDEREVFIDCGVFDADTIVNFVKYYYATTCKENYEIYGYEADYENYRSALKNISNYGINAVINNKLIGNTNCGLYDKPKFNSRSEPSDHFAQTATLDSELCSIRPTYIKMDIEGSEVDALKGGRKVIYDSRPKLGICSYHVTSHLIEVPLFIRESFPNYKLYIRHHSPNTLWETVVYGIPEK